MSTTLATPVASESVELDMGGLTDALSAFNPANPTTPVEQPKPAEPPAPAPDAPVEAAKPADAKPADEKPKKGLDALPGEEVEEKKEEVKKEEPAAEEPEVDTSKWAKPQQQAFAAMRAETKRAKEQAKDAQIRYEKLQKEYETFKATPKDSEETSKKLAELETWKRAQDLKGTPEWKTSVEAPIQQSLSLLERIAGHAKIDAKALIDATDEPIQFERILAIRKVFEAAEEPVPDTLITAAVNEADKLHPLYEKASKMEKEAEQTLNSLNHQTEQQKAAAAKAEEAAYLKHHDHIYGQMAAKLPSIFSNPEVAEEIKSARPATDPADKAFQAQAAAALPTIVKELFAAREEVKKERAAKLALLNTRPGVKGTSTVITKSPNEDDTELDSEGLTEALRGVRAA
jgi:hypothetical protein